MHCFTARLSESHDAPAVIGLPVFRINADIRRRGADHASIIDSVGPVVTLALAYAVLDEPLGRAQVTGATPVLLGVLVVRLSWHAK